MASASSDAWPANLDVRMVVLTIAIFVQYTAGYRYSLVSVKQLTVSLRANVHAVFCLGELYKPTLTLLITYSKKQVPVLPAYRAEQCRSQLRHVKQIFNKPPDIDQTIHVSPLAFQT